ncbi:TonB-dependent siderophore receptor [Variovorax sp. RO1]|uniref:TonB-dependent siderophore receptor n=1 Tax=Variovorax sp. RO1 TaxID=2066034 RepID=UPI000C718556|nr:TonB-dependent siderophore receptor [Variovorax sp. RO1]PLC06715.1 TonB-dependent siderophore receptor [Variovorax sp. RO1]
MRPLPLPRQRLLNASLVAAFGTATAFWSLSALAQGQQQPPSASTAAPSAAGSTLPVVTVRDEPEVANGPVQGYVARRSATGTKTDTPLIETPQSISVIGREELDARGVQNIMEAVRYTPGVAVGNWGYDARGIDWLLLRGFDATNAMYRDGLRLAPYSLTEPYGVERVEVLRGPASVAYGQSDAGGVINRVSKMPSATAVREVEVQLGSFGRKQLGVDLGGAISDTLTYRLVGVAHDSNTQESYPNGDAVKVKRDYLAPSLRWQPSAATSFTVLAEFLQSKAGDDTGYVVGPKGVPTWVKEGEPRFSWIKQKQNALGYMFEHHFNDSWTVRQNVRFNDFDTDKTHMRTALQADGRTLLRTARADPERVHQLTADTNVQGRVRTGAAEHTLLFGIDWMRNNYSTSTRTGPAPSLDLLFPVYGLPVAEPTRLGLDTSQTTEQLGVYLQDQIKIADRWVVTLSGRQDHVKTNSFDRLAGKASSQTDDKFSGRAGLTYLFPNGWAPYVSYGESFLPTSGVDLNSDPFRPSRGKQWEAGVKFQPEGARSLFTAAVFDLRKSNVVTYDQQTFEARQIGRIRSRGLELEGKTEIARNLNLTASYTWLDMKVIQSADTNELGNMPIQVPKQTASLWLDYTMDNGWGVGGGMRYIGRRYNNVTNTDAEGGVTLLDATVHYRQGPWRFSVSATNLANRKYTASRAYGGYYPGNDRAVVASAKYQF